MEYYVENYELFKLLNPQFPFLIRTVDNAMPAITTDLEWTIQDLLRFMIQSGRFRDPNGTISRARVEAAEAYLAMDLDQLLVERFRSPNLDPERPDLDVTNPGWRDSPQVQQDLATYFHMKRTMDEQLSVIKSGPNDEFVRAENALVMCNRVDLWCAGPKEVERAVLHLYKLGRALNERETELPTFIAEFYPGSDDLAD